MMHFFSLDTWSLISNLTQCSFNKEKEDNKPKRIVGASQFKPKKKELTIKISEFDLKSEEDAIESEKGSLHHKSIFELFLNFSCYCNDT